MAAESGGNWLRRFYCALLGKIGKAKKSALIGLFNGGDILDELSLMSLPT
ncbi:hypothetical protein THTE_1414 [Thermogutta terrifontis]|uniref:Uncharacterized protein n=1 Tax=Thermogutta terrifontis TaxID=1331910 RepID=A0A286RDI3_9BACT|nr:hypothetical protein THTE_1414 [Thermogutta terrifontis]